MGEPTASRPKRATIYDVARLANVSHQTVSRLIKGHSNIRPDTRERIERALAELEYRPNLSARTLATSRSRLIGALVYDVSEMGPSKTTQGATERAREAGYLLDIVSIDRHDDADAQRALDVFRSRDLAGIVAWASTDVLVEAIRGIEFDVPVYVEQETDDRLSGTSLSLNGLGELMLIEHLYELGHRRFHYVSGPNGWISARNRETAYEQALRGHGLVSIGTSYGDWSAASGHAAVHAMSDAVGFTALVAANDQMALGAMLALSERGISVPGDVSVVGFDDLPEAAFYRPPLTTVGQNFHQQGKLAIDRLLSMIDPALPPAGLYPVKPELRVRLSTGPVLVRSS